MGNRYGARTDEFAWTLGARRRLKRYIWEAELTYAEAALLLGTTRGSVAGAAARFDLMMSVEQQRDRQARQGWERAQHGERSRDKRAYHSNRRGYWDHRLIETWAERKRRLARERAST